MDKSKIMPCLISVVIGAGIGYLGYSESHKSEEEFCKNYHEVIEAYDIIKKNYYAELDNNSKIEQELVKGLVKGLDDRFCSYYTEEEFETMVVNNSPSVLDSGFAVERDEKTKLIKVIKVDDGSQAEKMGLKLNDLITAIDGVKVEKNNYPEVVQKLQGKDGTVMKLDIRRQSDEFSINFMRVNGGRKDTSTITKVIDNNLGYIKFDSFENGSSGSAYQFKELVDELQKENKLKALIIDLRENGGGAGSHSVDIFDLFSESGSIVKCIETKTNKVFEESSTTDEITYDFPIEVLVSGDTYSAAEIFAALVQSTGRGQIIGTQTGGKGVYQFGEYLSDSTMINLVEGYYYVNDLPNFNNIGITPDVVIEMDKELIGTDEDIQLKKAIELLN